MTTHSMRGIDGTPSAISPRTKVPTKMITRTWSVKFDRGRAILLAGLVLEDRCPAKRRCGGNGAMSTSFSESPKRALPIELPRNRWDRERDGPLVAAPVSRKPRHAPVAKHQGTRRNRARARPGQPRIISESTCARSFAVYSAFSRVARLNHVAYNALCDRDRPIAASLQCSCICPENDKHPERSIQSAGVRHYCLRLRSRRASLTAVVEKLSWKWHSSVVWNARFSKRRFCDPVRGIPSWFRF
jgi:hypothetical protein